MSTDLLAADTRMGAVTLRVADLDTMTAYYRDAVTLSVLAASGDEVVLGRGTEPMLRARPRPRAAARTVPLGRAVPHRDPVRLRGRPGHGGPRGRHPAPGHLHRQRRPPGQPGVLLHRPGGQRCRALHRPRPVGLELDPRSGRDGHVDAGPEPVPARSSRPGSGGGGRSSRPATVGHVHLCVGDVDSARRFYVDQLGFETTAELGNTALFVSAGGYHHHMAMNTWQSRGAGRRRLTLGSRSGPDRGAVPGRPRRA